MLQKKNGICLIILIFDNNKKKEVVMKRRTFISNTAILTFLAFPITRLLAKNLKKGVYMIIHTAESRGIANHGWLKSRHTFSFADYYDPKRMNFGVLRVINDDYVEAGRGFGTHPHKDMEIISVPLEGDLAHKDSEGNSGIIRHGEVQIMSAGTGIYHSEMNASQNNPVKFLQIWVLPKKLGVKPRYEQKLFPLAERKNKIATVVSPDGRNGSVTINQDAFFSFVNLDSGKVVSYERQHEGNGVYLFVTSGEIIIDGKKFKMRDGIGIPDFKKVEIQAINDAEVLLMEVPMSEIKS